jgi:hypothetical protein
MERSILDLNTNELLEIQKTKKLPEGVTLKGIEGRKDFDVLYRHRSNPTLLAEHLLKDTKGLEQKRLDLKQAELDLRKEKVKGQTFLLKDLKTHLIRIETKLDFLIGEQVKRKKEE